jgi:hypothetical protein
MNEEDNKSGDLLISPYVFIDATEYIRHKYYFQSEVLRSLARLSKMQSIKVLITKLTLDEVRANIKKDVHESVRELRSIRNNTAVLRQVQPDVYAALGKELDAQHLSQQLIDKMEAYVDEVNFEVLDYGLANPSEVFKRYFSSAAPFGSGAKRKNEFPDAFAIQIIEEWSTQKQVSVSVVSADKGLAEVCENNSRLRYFERLEKFLDLAIRQDSVVAQMVDEYFERESDYVDQLVADNFEQLGFYVEDEDGDVEDVSVTNAMKLSHNIIEVDDMSIRVIVDYQVEFNADLSYPDPDFTWYDKETGQVHHLEYLSEQVERMEEVEFEIKLDIDRAEAIITGIDDIQLVNPGNIAVTTSAFEEASHFYK